MEIKLHKSTRGIWVFVDGKHKKTVPAKFETLVAKHIDKLDLSRKHLTDAEILIFVNDAFNKTLTDFMEAIKTNEPHLYRLIANAKPTGVRHVVSKNGNRYELCFDNNLKIKCSRRIFHKHPVKLPEAFLNY